MIDGGIANPQRTPSGPDALLGPDAYFALYRQHPGACAREIELRPGMETF